MIRVSLVAGGRALCSNRTLDCRRRFRRGSRHWCRCSRLNCRRRRKHVRLNRRGSRCISSLNRNRGCGSSDGRGGCSRFIGPALPARSLATVVVELGARVLLIARTGLARLFLRTGLPLRVGTRLPLRRLPLPRLLVRLGQLPVRFGVDHGRQGCGPCFPVAGPGVGELAAQGTAGGAVHPAPITPGDSRPLFHCTSHVIARRDLLGLLPVQQEQTGFALPEISRRGAFRASAANRFCLITLARLENDHRCGASASSRNGTDCAR